MNVDERKNQNCYNYGDFGHLARNYRNKRTEDRIGEGRRLEYGNNGNNEQRRINKDEQNNSNREGDLIVFD